MEKTGKDSFYCTLAVRCSANKEATILMTLPHLLTLLTHPEAPSVLTGNPNSR